MTATKLSPPVGNAPGDALYATGGPIHNLSMLR
jgi:hypothetical protein